MVRFPEGLRDRIKEAADANGRSMNSEIISRLEASFINKISLTDPEDLMFRFPDGEISFLDVVKRVIDTYEEEKGSVQAPSPPSTRRKRA
jgi:hypothetical protein